MSPLAAGNAEVGRHAPVPATSEAESEAESVVPRAQTTRKGVTLFAVAIVAALVVVGLAAGTTLRQLPGRRSAPAEVDAVAVTALEGKAEEAATELSMESMEYQQNALQEETMVKRMQIQKDQNEAADKDKEAWETAMESMADGSLVGQAGDVASEDGAGGAVAKAAPREWSEEAREEVRARLAGLQDKLDKAMAELNAKIAATKNLSAEEAERSAAEGQKRLAEWQAHPDHKQKRDEAVKASAQLQEVMAGLLEKRKQRLAAREADPEPSGETQ
jgi:hypothetical protein